MQQNGVFEFKQNEMHSIDRWRLQKIKQLRGAMRGPVVGARGGMGGRRERARGETVAAPGGSL